MTPFLSASTKCGDFTILLQNLTQKWRFSPKNAFGGSHSQQYNVTIEEEEEVPRNINIPEIEGHRIREGPQVENPNISAPSKIRQVNIGTMEELKFSKIGDY